MTSRILPIGIVVLTIMLIAAMFAILVYRDDSQGLSNVPPMPDGDLAFIMEPSGCYLCDVSSMLLGALICPGLPMLLFAFIFGLLNFQSGESESLVSRKESHVENQIE